MYVRPDMFLSEDAEIEVTRDGSKYTDVFIRVSDVNGSFEVVAYMSYPEAQALLGTYQRLTHHSTIMFGDLRVYAPHGGKIDDLKFTLEMM